MRESPGHGVTRSTFASAAAAPLIWFDDPTRQHCTIRIESLPDDLEPELVQADELGQIRADEGSVRHVEVFQMGSVRTPIVGRPRPLPGHRHTGQRYTLNCAEPDIAASTSVVAQQGLGSAARAGDI
jgi:hypothetical protein